MATRGEVADAARMSLRAAIVEALRRHGGNRTLAAQELEYATPTALRVAAKRVGLDIATLVPPPTPQEIAAKPRKPRAKRAVEARVRAALRAMLAVDARVTAATLRWEMSDEAMERRVSVRFGLHHAEDDAVAALVPQPDWRALAEAEGDVLRAAMGAAGDDGEEWTEVRE